MGIPLLKAKEHGTLDVPNELEDYKDKIRKVFSDASKVEMDFRAKSHLGVNGSLQTSYYIGAGWINIEGIEDSIPFLVSPKDLNSSDKNAKCSTDFISMFVTALNVSSLHEAEYFSDYYSIDVDAPPITLPEDQENLITPLLLLHYLSLLTQLTKGGLRKGYVIREENLQSKVRGRILFQNHLKQNVFNKREDRVFCRYQEYTTDIPENRLLKKALELAKSSLLDIPSLKKDVSDEIFQNVNNLEAAFDQVSCEVNISQVKSMSESKLFKHYAEAIKVAKMILRYFDYDVETNSSNARSQSIQPYCIDMSRLYEMYVFHKLNEAYPGKIKFQVPGRHKTQVDYIKTDEKIILDAKYKPRYEKGNNGIVDDVREISGYARDKKILDSLGWNERSVENKKGKLLPDCVIIYPVAQVEENDDGETPDAIAEKDCSIKPTFDKNATIISQSDEIKAFEGFYKIAVPLPVKLQKS